MIGHLYILGSNRTSSHRFRRRNFFLLINSLNILDLDDFDVVRSVH